jgi:hypothetical protein
VAQLVRGSGSPEVAIYGTPDLYFLTRLSPMALGYVRNQLCSPWEDVGQQWRLVWAGRVNASSASMAAGSEAPLAKLRAPAWEAVFGETPGVVNLAQAVAS